MVDWKKDVSPRKKEDGAEAVPDDGAAEASAAEERTPFWKKEISLGKGKTPKPAEDERTPFWKKEVRLGGGKAAAPAPGEEAIPEEAVVEDDAPALPAPVAVSAEAEPELELGLEPEPEPDPAEDLDEYGWLTAAMSTDGEHRSWVERVGEEPAPPAEEADVPEAAAEEQPLPAAEAAVDPEPEPHPEPEPESEPDPEPSAALSAVPPLTPSVQAPRLPAPLPGIHPPVPAAELPALPAEEEAPKPSLLKRDLSFRRSSGPPKESKEKKQPKEKKPKQKEQPAAAAAKEPRAPFWRRQVSVGRKPNEQQAGAPVQAAPAAAVPAPPAAKQRRSKRPKGGGQRHKRLVGLKIGASQIAAAEVVNNGSAQLVQVARDSLEPGIVVAGELREPDALAAALKEFFVRHKLPRRNVRLGIATNRIGVRSFELASIEDEKQLANAIRFRAQDALPIPIEEAVLDYQVVSEGVDAEGQPVRRVLLVVAYRELIDRYVDACRKAGIRLVGIDLEAFALLRALGAPLADGADGESATVAVSVGYDRTTFAVSDGRVCEFTRVLDWGGFQLNVAIARALDIAPSEAEGVKRALSLADGVVPDGLTAEQAELGREAVRKQVTSFARELVSSLQFYQNQPGSLSIATITVTGGTAHLGGLAAELERLIGVGVRIGDPLARVRVGKKVRADEQLGSLAVAIGLGIED